MDALFAIKYPLTEKNIDKPLPLSDFKIEKTWSKDIGDLKQMASEEKGEFFISLSNKNGQKAQIIDQRIIQPTKIYVDPSEYEFRYKSPSKNNSKIVFIRDSFFILFIKYVSEHFKESVFIFHREFDLKILKNEKPDFIVEEIVERDIDIIIEEDRPNIVNE
mgnify:CR=1 FL=1